MNNSKYPLIIAIIALLIASVGAYRAFKVDPVRIGAKQICDAYVQGSQYGAQAQGELINQELKKQIDSGEIILKEDQAKKAESKE